MNRLSDYLTVADAGSVRGVCKDTRRRWDRAGKLTARRHPLTRYRLYLKTELESLLKRLAAKAEGRPSRRRVKKKRSQRQ